MLPRILFYTWDSSPYVPSSLPRYFINTISRCIHYPVVWTSFKQDSHNLAVLLLPASHFYRITHLRRSPQLLKSGTQFIKRVHSSGGLLCSLFKRTPFFSNRKDTRLFNASKLTITISLKIKFFLGGSSISPEPASCRELYSDINGSISCFALNQWPVTVAISLAEDHVLPGGLPA